LSKYRWLLSSLIFCDNCGKPMTSHPINTKLKSGIKTYFYYYHQKKNPDDIKKGCTISVDADYIEEAVVLYLFNMYGDEEYLKRSVTMAFPDPEIRAELEKERESKLKNRKQIEAKMDNIVESIADGVFSKDQARKKMQSYQKQLDLNNDRIKAIDLELKDIPTEAQINEKVEQFRLRHEALSQLPERLSKMSYDEMKKMVLTAFNGEDIYGNRLGVYVKKGASKKEFTFTIKGILPEDDIYGDLPLNDDDYEDLLCWPTNRKYDLEKEKVNFRQNILGKHLRCSQGLQPGQCFWFRYRGRHGI